MQALNNYLIRFDWTTITSSTDVDECYSLFINEIIDAINFHCPLKKVHFRTSHNPWMTKGLINACNKKNNLYKKFIKNRNEINEQRYKKYKNKLISVLRMSKQEYYTKILNKHKNSIKETWNILRNVTGSSTANTFPNSFVIDNKLISNKNDIVNDFNNFFTNIGPDLAKNISNTSNKHFIDYLGTSVTESIFCPQFLILNY